MAKEPRQEKSLYELRQEVTHSRDRIVRDLSGLRYELDFPLKFRKSFQRQTVWWVTAAVVIGIAGAMMPARTRKISVQSKAKVKNDTKEGILSAGLAIGALKLALPLLKPLIKAFISTRVNRYADSSRKQ